MMAVGIMRVLHQAGVRVPEDISVVGMDNVPIARMVLPALTTVDQSFEEFCRRAFLIIHQQLENSAYRPPERMVRIPASVVIRGSYRNVGAAVR